MSHDEDQIRTLIHEWAAAVRAGELDRVLADHTADIVMYDVPPPQNGVRGIDAYRQTWPPFFTWLGRGATFDIVELNISAGADIAYAHALLRCGSPEELAAEPDTRLRLTLGLHKEGGRWRVAHEHHSFPDTTADPADDVAEIRALHQRWFAATAEKDLDSLMAEIATDVESYEHDAPLHYTGADNVREVCRRGLESAPGRVTWDVPEMAVEVHGDLAVVWGLNHMSAEDADGRVDHSWSRGTRVFRKRGGRWLLVHQHVSYPYDPETGAAATDLVPEDEPLRSCGGLIR
ncbi:nuclear transport factor 2 family protein [Nocardia sp. GTS18]|uniref:YybH family protein n=1 Tax=Nocardia sp. GTS18 TaxID=1778064 RepID=UPI0015EE96F5